MEEEITFVVQPYQFEPDIDSDPHYSSEEVSSESEVDSVAESNTQELEEAEGHAVDSWCKCGNCVAMASPNECKCCKDFDLCVTKMESEELKCVTDHEAFKVNCLNKHVLELAFYEYLDNNGPIGDEEPIHELYRYIAYRRFTRWIWHKLGKKNRKVIPSCVVSRIRKEFPSEEYTGFKYPRNY